MTVVDDTAAQQVAVVLRPRYEGANIRTWIGFKHFLYLAEDAVLGWFRDQGRGPSRLYHEFGVCVSVVDVSALLPAVLDIDDVVTAEVEHVSGDRFTIRLRARDGETVLRGKVRVALLRDHLRAVPAEPVPAELAAMATDSVEALEPAIVDTPAGSSFTWFWQVPYFYCQFSDLLQHSGYVRAVEEVVHRFLDARGISVGRMLTERGWIPVVSRVAVRMLAGVHMEETVRTTFTVTDVLRNMMFDGHVDFDVEREGTWVRAAQAQILHGYAISRGPGAGGLAEFDEATVAALTGRQA